MVLLFTSITVLALVAFIQTRINMKQQTRITFRQLKAHYLAQSGIQHALLKLRILPLESYDAAAVARGICPFLKPDASPPNVPAPAGGDIILKEFIKDVTTKAGGYPIGFPEFAGWEYFPLDEPGPNGKGVEALSADKEGDSTTHSVKIVIDGELNENYKGQALTTTDQVTRIVKITRSR